MKRALLLLALLLFANGAFAQEFSATIASPDDNESSGKVYVAGTHLRADMTDTSDGQSDVQVMLLEIGAKPRLVRLDPADKTFSAIAFDREANAAPIAVLAWLSGRNKQFCDVPGLKSCKFVGVRSVDKRTCDAYKASDADDEYEVCFDEQLHFPLAFRKVGEDAIELKNVKLGKQPDWLFVVPQGFKEVPFGCRLPAPPPPPRTP